MAFGDASKEFLSTHQERKVPQVGDASRAFIEWQANEEKRAIESERRMKLMREATPYLNMVSDYSRRELKPLTINDKEQLKQIDREAKKSTITKPVGAEIRAAEPTLGTKVDRAIRNVLPESIEKRVYDPLKDTLVGRTGEKEQRYALTGELVQPGFFPAFTRTEGDKIVARMDALQKTGMDSESAAQKAIEIVRSEKIPGMSMGGAALENDTSLTREQKDALQKIAFWEDVDTAFAVLDIASMGGESVARKTGGKILTKGAETVRKATIGADEAVQKILTTVADDSIPLAERVSVFQRLRQASAQKVKSITERLREIGEDEWLAVKNMQRNRGLAVTEESNVYDAYQNMPGRVQAKVDRLEYSFRAVGNDIREVATRKGLDTVEFSKTIEQYMKALHAKERIAAVGERGIDITAKQADEIIRTVEASDIAKDIKKISDELRSIHEKTLDMLLDEGIITKKYYASLREKYKKHVPLQRVFGEEEELSRAMGTKSVGVGSTGIKKAVGSEKQVDSIIGNIKWNQEQAILRVEKNRVARALLKLVQDNEKALPMFKVRLKKAIGEAWKTPTGERPLIMEQGLRENEISVFIDGKQHIIEVKDMHLASVLKNLNSQYLPALLNVVPLVTRYMSRVSTTWNVVFAPTNKLRDIPEAIIYAASTNIGGKRALSGAVKDAKSMNTVRSYVAKRRADPRFQASLEGDELLYQQMLDEGGSTGGYSAMGRSDVVEDWQNMMRLNRSNPKLAAKKVVEYVEDWNAIFEESTRFTAYKLALESGMTPGQAARVAKESTVNFNRMGTGGPIINAAWMFSNASIQANAKFFRAMKNPKVAAATTLAVGSSVAMAAQWNDTIDPDWRNKVTRWDRNNSLVIVLPGDPKKDDNFGLVQSSGGIRYIVIPVSWSLKPMKVLFDTVFDVSAGHETSVADATERFFTSTLEAYNPIGGTDVWSTITPTIGDLPLDIARNKTWYGGKIYKDNEPFLPDHRRFFPDIQDTASGRFFYTTSQFLSGVGLEMNPEVWDYAFNTIIGGAGRFVSQTVDTIRSIGKQEKPDPKNIPFVNRFYRTRTAEEVARGTDVAEVAGEYLTQEALAKSILNERAEQIVKTLNNTTSDEEIASILKELKTSDPDMVERVSRISDMAARGITYGDRLIIMMGVEDGTRAQYIYAQMMEMPPTQQDQYLAELAQKKILTKNVMKQVAALQALEANNK